MRDAGWVIEEVVEGLSEGRGKLCVTTEGVRGTAWSLNKDKHLPPELAAR
jgi:hypothetical protein